MQTEGTKRSEVQLIKNYKKSLNCIWNKLNIINRISTELDQPLSFLHVT